MLVQIDERHIERPEATREILPGVDSTRGRTCSSKHTSTRGRVHLPTVYRRNSNEQDKGMACYVETAQEHRKGGKTDNNQQPDIESNPYPMRTLYTDGSDAKNTQEKPPLPLPFHNLDISIVSLTELYRVGCIVRIRRTTYHAWWKARWHLPKQTISTPNLLHSAQINLSIEQDQHEQLEEISEWLCVKVNRPEVMQSPHSSVGRALGF